MDDLENKFLELCAVEGKIYSEIEKALNINRETARQLYIKTADRRSRIVKLRATYKRKGYKQTPFDEFRKKCEELEKSNECYYCGITLKEINQLFELQLIMTKRSNTRGKSLEYERVEPNKAYEDLNNLKLACYWCNNAKSDEFSADEFKPIGKQIGDALRARLRQRQDSSAPVARVSEANPGQHPR